MTNLLDSKYVEIRLLFVTRLTYSLLTTESKIRIQREIRIYANRDLLPRTVKIASSCCNFGLIFNSEIFTLKFENNREKIFFRSL